MTWAGPLLGGAMIGVAASLFWATQRRAAGISGLFAQTITPNPDASTSKSSLAFVLGLFSAGLVGGWVRPELFGGATRSLPWIVLGGFLVGFGTRLGNGCTSGHGVCGISQRSSRSFVATLTFILVGVATVTLLRKLLGGA